MSTMAPPPALITAEDFAVYYPRHQVELVGGRVVSTQQPSLREGSICNRVAYHLGQYVDTYDLGHVAINDSWVVTKRGPDTVRGSDILFVSYARLPKGKVPEGLLNVVPELVFEVRSPSDLWTDMIAKMLEYLSAGVAVVVILDPKTESASVFRPDDRQDVIEADGTRTIADVLHGFAVSVRSLFE
jgi:Uma2 family endonuclease